MFPKKKNISNSSIHWLLLFEFFFHLLHTFKIFSIPWCLVDLVQFSFSFLPVHLVPKDVGWFARVQFSKKKEKKIHSAIPILSSFFFCFIHFHFHFLFNFFFEFAFYFHIYISFEARLPFFYIYGIFINVKTFKLAPEKKWNEQKKKIV